jgi:hypothetical protein
MAQIIAKGSEIDFAIACMRRLKVRLEQRRLVMIKDGRALFALEAKQALPVDNLLKKLVVLSHRRILLLGRHSFMKMRKEISSNMKMRKEISSNTHEC